MPIEHTVQGDYGQGWEDVTVENTAAEAREQVRTYRREMPQYPHRYIARRIRYKAIVCATCAFTSRGADGYIDDADKEHLAFDGAHSASWYFEDTGKRVERR